jgi:hypothetical protein
LVGLVHKVNPRQSEIFNVSIHFCKEANKDVQAPWLQRSF